jgi:hypothetical protein
LHEYVRRSPFTPVVALTVPLAGAESAGAQACGTQVGVGLDQVWSTRQVVAAEPTSVKPVLQV